MTGQQYIEILNEISRYAYKYTNIDKREMLHDMFVHGGVDSIRKGVSAYLNRNSVPYKTICCGGFDEFEDELRKISHIDRDTITAHIQCRTCLEVYPETEMHYNAPQYPSRTCKKCWNRKRLSYHRERAKSDSVKEYQKTYQEAYRKKNAKKKTVKAVGK